MSKQEIDRLGERLRSKVTEEDLADLSDYCKLFRPSCEFVVAKVVKELGLEVVARPAKSNLAVIEKLRRHPSMRLTQMKDIAGCRIIVGDLATQDETAKQLQAQFASDLIDRRIKPSHGYRAVHLITKDTEYPVEIQVRTEIQHLWAQISERMSDRHGTELKYGGGPDEIRKWLVNLSAICHEVEQHPLNENSSRELMDALLVFKKRLDS